MVWDLSCPGWQDRLRSGKSLVPELPLYKPAADRAVAVFNKLRLADVSGTPTMEEAGGDWFRDVVRALFGSTDPATRERMIREVFLLVAKKNNKTTGGALLMLTALLLNERPRADFLLTGQVQDTANTAFEAAAGAIALDPVLEKKFHVRDHLKTIIHRETKASLQIVTFDPSIVTGRKLVGGLIDELHVLGKNPRAGKALLQLRGGMQPFPEAFLVMITTQSDEAPSGVFKEELLRARAVRDGLRMNDSLLPVLYEFPQEMQQDPSKPWLNTKNWPMVNPNTGLSVSIDRLHQLFLSEEKKGEGALRAWASQHLNVEIGLALHSDRWAGADYWEGQAVPVFTLDELLARCEVVVIGIDGGGLDDLLGLAVIGRDSVTREWVVWTHAWAHPSVMERRKSEAPRFLDFQRDGDLTIVKVIGDDVAEVATICAHVEASGKLHQIGMDPHGIGGIMDALVEAKLPAEKIVGISQGWKMTGAIKTAERKLAEGGMIHGGQPMMNWCVGNAKVEPRGNAVLITKQAAGTAKIDPLMAMLNATHIMALNPAAPGAKHQFFIV